MAAELVATPRQLLVNVQEALSASWYDDNGTLVDPGVTTVGITDVVGTIIVAAGTATAGTGAAARTYALAAQMELDILTVTWTSATYGAFVQTVEVVGALLFTVREARIFDNSALSNTSTYTSAAIDEARARITDEFESICGVSFVPRYRRDVLSGDGGYELVLPVGRLRALRTAESRASGTSIWTAYTASELADVLVEPWGLITRDSLGSFTTGTRNLRVGYEHGYDTPPLEVKQAALLALRYYLTASNLSDRAMSISTEFGTTNLWTPGVSGRGSAIHPLPEVDRVLRAHMEKRLVVA